MSAIVRQRQLRAEGWTDEDVRVLIRDEEATRLRRGVLRMGPPENLTVRARHHELITANLSMISAEAVVSHWSAAVLHGLPAPDIALDRVHVTRSRTYGGAVSRDLHLYPAPLARGDVADLGGVPVTSLARTVVDLGRHASLEAATAVADAALRLGLTSTELEAAVAAGRRRPGIVRARAVARMADGRSESVGESYSRVKLIRAGLAPSHLQHDVRDPRGRFVARSDFFWEEHRTVGEFDGRVKYETLVPAGRTAADVLWAEKRREDDVRSLGLEVVRWGWEDFARFQVVVERLHRAFGRAGARL